MSDRLQKLLNEYKETKRCLEMGIEWLPSNDFAKAKLEVVNMIIEDLEKIDA
ncbi:hypothetical protein ACED96_04245 [Clostridium thermobutyricum]|jgi:hypothetical protein|uniref:Uncharacterized protein n=2 Tax=Clostridium thermobutyricum TaxID=29372 RepID=N9XXS6_9CLOT|nr:hypothetical protein [Clostridium thermobutyricum]ENZ00684.1 hypothetical protein HMPREF1092_02336 [Clostridium thermobutyricum]OPX46822.1 hypothetical protein CLTHE_26430 [Clostridium thermobutyricum DSM 4928]